jgi:hypothetical protein
MLFITFKRVSLWALTCVAGDFTVLGQFPMRLGGNGYPSSFSARDSKHFEITDGQGKKSTYIAVASSDGDPASQDAGGVFVYEILLSPEEAPKPMLVQVKHRQIHVHTRTCPLSDCKALVIIPLTFVCVRLLRSQILSNEIACSSITVIAIRDVKTLLYDYYMVVGNSFSLKASATALPLNFYKWSFIKGRFEFRHSPAPSAGRMGFVSKVESLSVLAPDQEDEHIVAISNFWDGESTVVESLVLRFDSLDQQFKVLAPVMGNGALDMVLVPVGDRIEGVLVVLANTLPSMCGNVFMNTSFVAVYRISRWSGDLGEDQANLTLVQCIRSQGVVDLESFNIDGMWMLAVSKRQAHDDVTYQSPSYSQSSSIYVWSKQHESYRVFQELDTDFSSLPESSSTPEDKQAFCAAGGVKGSSSECKGSSYVVPGLRGVTGMHYFEEGGEKYLAVAQSVCAFFSGTSSCKAVGGVQPQSAVLQYDGAQANPLSSSGRGKFTELKRLSRFANLELRGSSVKEQDYVQSSAMRFDGGRASGIRFIELNYEPFLLLSSLTRGAVLMRWKFDTVVGIMSVNAIATDDWGWKIVAASASSRTLTLISAGDSTDPANFDVLGNPVCEKLPCLIWRQTVREEVDVPINANTPVNVLSGVRHAYYKRENNMNRWALHPQPSKTELLCFEGMPASVVPDPRNASQPGGLIETIPLEIMLPPCQSLTFIVEGVSGPYDFMFAEMPRLLPNGTLTFVQTAAGWGDAGFVATIQDSAGGYSTSSFFQISIAPVIPVWFNLATPSGQSVILVDAVPRHRHEVIFARKLSLGSVLFSAEQISSLAWQANVSNRSLFASAPEFVFERDETGDVVGVMIFEISLFESGSSTIRVSASYHPPSAVENAGPAEVETSNHDPAATNGDSSWYGESDEVEFTLTARTRNYPPGAGVTQDVIVMEDSAPVSLPCWVQNLSSGSPYESWQALYIYRSNIEMLEGLISPEVSCMHSILRMGGMLCSELGQQV